MYLFTILYFYSNFGTSNAQLFTNSLVRKQVCQPIRSRIHEFDYYLQQLRDRIENQKKNLNHIFIDVDISDDLDEEQVIAETVTCQCAKHLKNTIQPNNWREIVKLMLITQRILTNETRFRKQKLAKKMVANLSYCYTVYWSVLPNFSKKKKVWEIIKYFV